MNFDGLSFLSKGIKLWTRSKDSHSAVLDYEKGCLIEVWGGLLHVYWRYSDFSAHTPGTPYEVWELQVKDEQYEKAMSFYRWLADRKFPYNYLGVIGFVLPIFISNRGFFCSEGCWEGLFNFEKKVERLKSGLSGTWRDIAGQEILCIPIY